MIRIYLLVAVRNLFRHKSYTLLNLIGLTLGIASCSIVFIFIRFELSFDNFHSSRERIYRVVRHTNTSEGIEHDTGVPFTMGKELRDEASQVSQTAMIFGNSNSQIDVLDDYMKDMDKRFKVDGIAFVEPEFFEMFNFNWLAGNPNAVLSNPKSVALTVEMAEKYYGTWQNAMNKYLRLDNRDIFKVSGIINNIPVNSDFPLNIVFSYKALGDDLPGWNTTRSGVQCYIALLPENSPAEFNGLLKDLSKKYLQATSRVSYSLQPFSEIHFDGDYGNYNDRTIDKNMLRAFGIVGLFILFTSCINFINLALAKSFQRAKEVGIRKSLGSGRTQLILLYLGETCVLVIGAIILGVILTQVILPLISPLINLPQNITWLTDPLFVLFLVLVFFSVSLLSGLYPAFRTSSLRPVQALKDNVQKIQNGFPIRKVLIVVQFFIAQGLIFCMFIVTEQYQFFRSTPLGFNKDAIVTVAIPSDSIGRAGRESFRNRLMIRPEIKSISYSWRSPAVTSGNWLSNFRYNRAEEAAPFQANLKWAEPEFFNTYGLQIIAGRMYVPGDTIREVVVNEHLVKELGIENLEEVIGKTISVFDREYPIVGVAKNFHVYSLQRGMRAVIMGTHSSKYSRANISLQPNKIKEGIAQLRAAFEEIYPSQVFEFEFVDESVANFYQQEEKFSALFKIFAGLAIVIGCLGLFGLVSLTVIQRTKEIGVRKVLGATLHSLVVLLSKEFMILVLIASFLALPVGWWLMKRWLSDFAYKIEIGWFTFVVSVISSMLIAWLALSFQTIKASLANPVDSLRNE